MEITDRQFLGLSRGEAIDPDESDCSLPGRWEMSGDPKDFLKLVGFKSPLLFLTISLREPYCSDSNVY